MATSVKMTKADEGNNTPPKIETFDDILPHVGEAGWYQLILFVMLLPLTFAYGFLYFTQFFLTLVPEEHWCTVPELNNTAYNLTVAQKFNLTIPLASEIETRAAGEDIKFSRCLMYAVNFTEVVKSGITMPNSSWPTKPCDQGWTFDQSIIPYASIAAEFGWVCDKTYLSSLAQSAFFVGSMFGGLIFGYIADHYGRIPALVSCNAVGFVASIATAFCNSFWSFTVARMIAGMAFDNCFNLLFIINVEYIGPKWRTLMLNMSLGLYFGFSAGILPWLAYWIADWRILSCVTALPMIAAFVTPWIVPESARWYLISGKSDKAIEMLKKFARVNGKTVEPEIYEEFKQSCEVMMNKENKFDNYTVFDLFKKPRLAWITVILILFWLSVILVFDGNVWNMKLLDPNVFTSFSLAALTELPAGLILVLTLDRLGRRWMGFLSMFMAGLFSFIAIATPDGFITVSMSIIARLCLNIAANLGFQWAAEMLPTVVRAQGVSLMHIIGYLPHMMGPYIIYLEQYGNAWPLACLGLISLFGALLSLMLPETLGQNLPESLQEGNDFGKKQNFWWFPCISTSQLEKNKYRKKPIDDKTEQYTTHL